MDKLTDNWYKIDNAGKIFHAVSRASNSSVFRLSMIVKEPVDPGALQIAVDRVIQRFPTLAVKLYKGVFWYFLGRNENRLLVEEETEYPCHPIHSSTNNGYLIRVLYFNKRISVEVFHSLTDGVGAIDFLKSIVYQYFLLLGKEVTADDQVMLPSESPSTYETEDSFEKYYYKTTSNRTKESTGFHIKGTPFKPIGNNVIHGVINVTELNIVAKQNNLTITEYLTSVLIYAIYTQRMKYGIYNKPIKIAIPVNLRNAFPSKTLRNFFTVVNIAVNVSAHTTFESIATEVIKQFKEKVTEKNLYEGIVHNVKLQKLLAARFIPVAIKHLFMRQGFKRFGENIKTMTISNLGRVTLPEAMSKHVERMEVVVYPTGKSPISCGICSINDQMTITFSRSIVEVDIIQYFFKFLADHSNIPVKVFSNNWGVDT